MVFSDLLLVAGDLGSSLIALDKEWLLAVNGSDSLFLDRMAKVLTTAITWLPMYLSLFFVVLHNNESVRKVIYVLLGAGLCVLLAGAVDDEIVKPLVARWRPTHDPEIGMQVDIVNGYRGGNYGFFSAHAANTFSIAVFFCWLIRSRVLSWALVIWSLTNCWTRMYLGVHFPGDILVGLTWGFMVGSFSYFLYYRTTRKLSSSNRRFVSSKYTSTGYLLPDCDIPVAVLVFTLLYALIRSCIV